MEARMSGSKIARAVVGAALAAHALVAAADYPEKTITFVVPFAAGSATDQLARALGQGITAATRQPVVVDDRAGASGFIGAQLVAKAAPDGYTVFITTNTTHAANEHLFKALPYDPVKDFAPVTALGRGGQILVVNPSVPAKSVAELIAIAKTKPGSIAFGSGSSTSRVAGELFQQMAGVQLLHVPYKSNPLAINDLLGGQIQMMITDMPTGLPQVKAGKLRALGVSSLSDDAPRAGAMTKSLRIGSGAGFAGDRLDAALVLAERGELDFLTLECLAERTIALAQLRRRNDPATGYDPRLERRIIDLLPVLKPRGFRIVSNMGAANPLAAGEAIVAIAKRLAVAVKVAVVTGDDVLALIDPDERALEDGLPLAEHGPLVSANAYLGADAIVPALATGADIVITGRVADPSLFVAPIATHHGWSLDDHDRVARGIAVGHLLECAGQLCGGYFADPGRKDVPDMAHLGFPFADVDADGRAMLAKVNGTGGAITLATVKGNCSTK